MRILLVHNFYRSGAPSGENINFEATRSLLIESGHEVSCFERNSDEIARASPRAMAQASFFAPWNPFAGNKLKSTIEVFGPDLVHIENTFPLISPSAYWAVSRCKVPVVAGFHNYRTWCAAGTAYRDGHTCLDCMNAGSVIPALRHRCYKGSFVATLPVVATIELHRRLRTYARTVELLIANSAFLKRSLAQTDCPEEKIVVNHNFVPDAGKRVPWAERENTVVYVGRLSPEKGVGDLIMAWSRLGRAAPKLLIIGDGPQRTELAAMVEQYHLGSQIDFLGRLPYPDVMERIARSKLLVFPSRWFETFGRGVVEAYMQGVPVAVSDIGALPELVEQGETGTLFGPGDVAGISSAVSELFLNEAVLEKMGLRARSLYKERFTPAAALSRLEGFYQAAVDSRRSRSDNGN